MCSVLLSATFAYSQQVDIAVGDSGTFSSTYNNSSQTFLAPAEKGGTYPSFSAGVFLWNRLGVNGEVAVRKTQGLYNGYQAFRPILYDFNADFAPRLTKKARADFMAGVGGESVRFDLPNGNCTYSSGCPIHLSDNHFLLHAGADVRYYFWRHFFVRPEIHYYRVLHNTIDFKSDNLFRAGASVGYTFGTR